MADFEIQTLSGKFAVDGYRDVLGTNGILCTHKSSDNGKLWTLSHRPTGLAIHCGLKTRKKAEHYGRWFWSQLAKTSKTKYKRSDHVMIKKTTPASLVRQVKIDRAKESDDES